LKNIKKPFYEKRLEKNIYKRFYHEYWFCNPQRGVWTSKALLCLSRWTGGHCCWDCVQECTFTRPSKRSANFQQTSSISTCILNTFAGSLLDVCWIV